MTPAMQTKASATEHSEPKAMSNSVPNGDANGHDEESHSATVEPYTSSLDNTEDRLCLLCNNRFNLLQHKRFQCKICALSVCRACAVFDDPEWICTVCDQQRTISSQNNCQSWMCKRIKTQDEKELIHLINAKLKLDEKHGPLDVFAATFDGDRAISKENLIATRSDVELIIIQLLGIDTIDYAHIGLLFDEHQYLDLITTYTDILADCLVQLQESILKSQFDKDCPLSPTEAFGKLKTLLDHISEKSFEFPLLRFGQAKKLEVFIRECQSYEHLLANSIVNQCVEVSQNRFLTKSGTSSSISGRYSSLNCHRSSCGSGSLSNESEASDCHKMNDGGDGDSEIGLDCGKVANSGQFDSLQHDSFDQQEDYVDEEEDEAVDNDDEEEEEESGKNMPPLNFDEMVVFFPEAGINLVDSRHLMSTSCESNLSQDSGIKLIDSCGSWKDNWLFKKNNKTNKSFHQYHLNSDIHFGYMALAMSKSVPMLIPNPSHSHMPLIGDADFDQVSDMSENESEASGSIIFSEDDEEELNGEKEEEVSEEAVAKVQSSPVCWPDVKTKLAYIEKIHQMRAKGEMSKKLKNSHLDRWSKISVPDYVPSELRTICSSIPNPQTEQVENIPSLSVKPANASIHSGIIAQFCCKSKGLMPLHFAWYKDGQLIAASDDCRSLEMYEDSRMARIYFGLRFTHRRFVESNCSVYRLIVFNDNECILELKKSNQSHSGIYSVVAYNHFGYDWADFRLTVDRTHYSANQTLFNKPLSPRPIRRRPQNKPRKHNFNHFSEIIKPIETNMTVSKRFEVEEPKFTEMEVDLANGIAQRVIPYDIVNEAKLPAQLSPQLINIDSVDEALNSCSLNDEMKSRTIELASNGEESLPITELIASPPPNVVMPIAEREHRKWLNPDVSLTNNPYSTENIENRAKQMHSFTSVDSSEDRKPEEDPEEIEEKNSEKKKYFSSNRDITRYKRDYYLPDSLAVQDAPPGCSILDSLSGKRSLKENCDSEISEPENSVPNGEEEKVVNGIPKPVTAVNGKPNGKITVTTEPKFPTLQDQSLAKLPSVKNLVSLFSTAQASASSSDPQSPTPPPANDKILDRVEKVSRFKNSDPNKKNVSNFKVHSLTARSMSREFREQNHRNTPHLVNRISLTNEMLGVPGTMDTCVEGVDSVIASSQASSTPSLNGSDSGESLTNGKCRSVDSGNAESAKSNGGGDSIPAVLKRASYWDKRLEEGIVSDSNVKESFPSINGSST